MKHELSQDQFSLGSQGRPSSVSLTRGGMIEMIYPLYILICLIFKPDTTLENQSEGEARRDTEIEL